LTNYSPDLCVLTLCIKIRQNSLSLASLTRISANSYENYRRCNFQALANISGNFQKIYTLVRPHLEYAHSVRSPYRKGDVEAIETRY